MTIRAYSLMAGLSGVLGNPHALHGYVLELVSEVSILTCAGRRVEVRS